MAQEIERKFLLTSDEWRTLVHKKLSIRQGYLCNNQHTSVRIRIQDQAANINIKSMTIGLSRAEYEYSIPVAEAQEMLDTLCDVSNQLHKDRYLLHYAGKLWEIDVFHGENEGLVVAEVELESESEVIDLPTWVGREVSTIKRYYNMCLCSNPYSKWTSLEKKSEE